VTRSDLRSVAPPLSGGPVAWVRPTPYLSVGKHVRARLGSGARTRRRRRSTSSLIKRSVLSRQPSYETKPHGFGFSIPRGGRNKNNRKAQVSWWGGRCGCYNPFPRDLVPPSPTEIERAQSRTDHQFISNKTKLNSSSGRRRRSRRRRRRRRGENGEVELGRAALMR
jgi:hypothetical protein